jgi:DNA-binding CsgD family transcriptional regulator
VMAGRTPRPRGCRGGYEPRIAIRAREARVLQLSLQGRTQHEIAAAEGISQPAVSKILRRVDDRMLQSMHRERIRLLVCTYLRTDHVYRQAQEGWERSCADRCRRRQRRISGGTTTSERDVVEILTEAQSGDPRFLREQLRALAEQRTTFQLQTLDWVHIADILEHDDSTATTSAEEEPCRNGHD